MRAPLHYLGAMAVLAIYGVQVCPYLESLTPAQLGAPLAGMLALQFLARRPLLARLVESAPFARRARRALVVEFGLFVTSALLLTVFNALVYDFPAASGLKLLVGFVALGVFIAVDLALELELALARRLQERGEGLELSTTPSSVSRKLALFATISAALTTVVLFLVVNKDLEWLGQVGAGVSLDDARRSILIEFGFVAVILLGHVLNVVASHARTLRFFFEAETAVLERANHGDLSGRVAVGSDDEFGVIAHHTNLMVAAIDQRTRELQRTQDVTILGLASLAETRDNETGAHILRTQRYVRALAVHLASHPRHRAELDARTIDLLYKSAPLHDVGKVGIPDSILLKPGRLDDAEFAIMKTHAALGARAIAVAERALNESGEEPQESSFLHLAREIALTHHEKWDGSGYPEGLAGTAIPLPGRLMAVADVYDALISKRVYKPAFSHEKAREILLEGRGSHFDPEVVDAFLALEEHFKDIAASLRDEDHDGQG